MSARSRCVGRARNEEAAGADETALGLLRAPFDRGYTLLQGFEGTLMSLPELAFRSMFSVPFQRARPIVLGRFRGGNGPGMGIASNPRSGGPRGYPRSSLAPTMPARIA